MAHRAPGLGERAVHVPEERARRAEELTLALPARASAGPQNGRRSLAVSRSIPSRPCGDRRTTMTARADHWRRRPHFFRGALAAGQSSQGIEVASAVGKSMDDIPQPARYSVLGPSDSSCSSSPCE